MSKQLLPVPFITPGFSGLNKAKAASTTLGPEWALELQNCVFDLSGRVASRSGWVKQNTSGFIGAGGVDFGNVVLLLHGEGADASTTFTDSSSYAHTATVGGNAQIDTGKFKFGASSMQFDGTSDSLQYPANAEFEMGSQDFTIEGWIWVDSAGTGVTRHIYNGQNGGAESLVRIQYTTNSILGGVTGVSSATYTAGGDPGNMPVDQWIHVAFVRNGTSLKLYINGTASATTAVIAEAVKTTPDFWYVGKARFGGTASHWGWIDDFRIIRGTAVYTSNFTPPAGPFSDTSTGGFDVEAIGEFIKADGSVQIVSAGNLKLFSGTTTPTDITGAVVPTTNNWQFQNFNDIILGFQPGQAPISWNGAGNFATIAPTSGTAPTGGAAIAAFGRIWGVDADNNTIKYCGLLDHLNWGNAGSGSINMRSIWTRGTDQVVGIAAVGATLVVFGKRHIVLFTDGKGSTLGLDPATMYVVDTIEGTGLVGRDTVAPIGEGDLLYLSPTGVQSLSRTIQNKNNPLASVDGQVRDYVASFTAGETVAKLRAVYNADKQFYLLILPTSGRDFAYDTKFPLQDGSLRVTEWTSMSPKCAVFRTNNTMLMGLNGAIGLYSGFRDNTSAYPFQYTSPNVYLTEEVQDRLKILKRLGSVVFTKGTTSLTYQWGFDFEGFTGSLTRSVQGGNVPEYGRAEYGSNGKYDVNDTSAVAGVNFSEYGGGLSLRIVNIPASGAGRWIQVGISASISGSELAIQQLDVYSKIGGMV